MHFKIPEASLEEVASLKEETVKQPPISIEELEIDCEGSEVLVELLKDMLDKCLDYTITVAKFKRIALEGKGEITESL